MSILSNIQLLIERSIEKRFYNILLEHGYIPDRTTYANDPDGYEAEKINIRNDKGFCVELIGNSVSTEAGDLKLPRIVIRGLGFYTGSLGNDPTVHYEYNGINDNYDAYIGPPASSNYRVEISLISNKVTQDRLLESVRQVAISNRTYIPFYDNSDTFLLTYGFVNQNPELSKGIIEKIYTYEAIDVFEQANQLVNSGIAKISEITLYEGDRDNNDIIHKSE